MKRFSATSNLHRRVLAAAVRGLEWEIAAGSVQPSCISRIGLPAMLILVAMLVLAAEGCGERPGQPGGGPRLPFFEIRVVVERHEFPQARFPWSGVGDGTLHVAAFPAVTDRDVTRARVASNKGGRVVRITISEDAHRQLVEETKLIRRPQLAFILDGQVLCVPGAPDGIPRVMDIRRGSTAGFSVVEAESLARRLQESNW